MRQVRAHEHGPDGGDELNLIKPGGNYGWPRIALDQAREEPVVRWDQAIGPSGMAFYFGDKFPFWRGNLFSSPWQKKSLRRIAMERDVAASQEELLKELGEPIRDVRSGADGFLYVLTGAEHGRLLGLEPAPSREHD
jgi:glucose/arabinose dehydrogenase